MHNHPIGVFDSGVGGLSVFKELIKILPNESFIYFGDSGNSPYGSKQKSDILRLIGKNIRFLIEKKCKLIVVACNTATAAAIKILRQNYSIPFIGMEPAVKVAAQNSKTGHIGILATENTFNGNLFKETTRRFASHLNVHIQVGYGLVEIVENDRIETRQTHALLKKYLCRMIDLQVDQIVLGCTHYPFLSGEINKIIRSRAQIIDPALAVADNTKNVLKKHRIEADHKEQPPVYQFYTTGKKHIMEVMLTKIVDQNHQDLKIIKIDP